MKQFKMLLLSSMVILFTACGGGSSDGTSIVIAPPPPVEAPPVPPVDDNILPTADAGPDLSVEVNNTVTITGSGTDSDGTIVLYEWRKDGEVIAQSSSFEYMPTVVGIDTLTLTVTDDDGLSASDSMDVSVRVPAAAIGEEILAPDGLTVTVNSIIIDEKVGSYTYTVDYTLENKNTSGSIDEGTFKMFYLNEEGGLPQYGFFGTLFPGDIISRTYTFEEEKTKPFSVLAYGELFFESSPLYNSPTWEIVY